MMMMNDAPAGNELERGAQGRLVLVGTGISALAHLTAEAIGHIRNAEIVFYHATDGVAATHIRGLNPNSVDLYALYGEGKSRTATYLQMAEVMLNEVRRGRYVAGVFHGHAGFFVKAGRRALAIARIEGHATQLLASVSTPDCLFADLRIDPGVIGVQIMKAGHILRENTRVATDNHVILLQVSSVGDNSFSFGGYKRAILDKFFEKLLNLYGDEHESVCYEAAIFPGFDPQVTVRRLAAYREHELIRRPSAPTLYLPPAGIRLSELTGLQAFDNQEPYAADEMSILAELANYQPPKEYRMRTASPALMRVVETLTHSPVAVLEYRRFPEKFLAAFEDLTEQERRALAARTTREMREATQERGASSWINAPMCQRSEPRTVEEDEPAIRGSGSNPVSYSDDNAVDREFSMRWTPERQWMRAGAKEFVHDGSTDTHPSHDIAHLMVAANGKLLWTPDGSRSETKIAEYNAVFLEHLMTNAYNAVTAGTLDLRKCFEQGVAHARWFVEHHYKPFPLTAEEAYFQFCRFVDVERITSLSPYFFRQKSAERADANFMQKTWSFSMSADDRPTTNGGIGRTFQEAIRMLLKRMTV